MSNRNQANQVHGFGRPVKEGRLSGEVGDVMSDRLQRVDAATANALALGSKFYEWNSYEAAVIPQPEIAVTGNVPQPQIAANLGIQTMNLLEQQAPQPAAQPDPVAELYGVRPGYTQNAERLGVPVMNAVIDPTAGYDVTAFQGDQHAELV
jgi:hypothetical protein